MEDRIWDGHDLTPEVVRAWGYDDGLLLLDQDEDLLLWDFQFLTTLLELAGDESCPKQEYAFHILCQFCREQVTRGGKEGSEALREAWTAIPKPVADLPVQWHQFVGRLLSYTDPAGPIDKAAARRMAQDLLLGVAGRVGEVVEVTSPRARWWRFTLRTSITEHLDVSQGSGTFTYTMDGT